jgi:hypothetical protein
MRRSHHEIADEIAVAEMASPKSDLVPARLSSQKNGHWFGEVRCPVVRLSVGHSDRRPVATEIGGSPGNRNRVLRGHLQIYQCWTSSMSVMDERREDQGDTEGSNLVEDRDHEARRRGLQEARGSKFRGTGEKREPKGHASIRTSLEGGSG